VVITPASARLLGPGDAGSPVPTVLIGLLAALLVAMLLSAPTAWRRAAPGLIGIGRLRGGARGATIAAAVALDDPTIAPAPAAAWTPAALDPPPPAAGHAPSVATPFRAHAGDAAAGASPATVSDWPRWVRGHAIGAALLTGVVAGAVVRAAHRARRAR
jgi:hypothetical protein